MRIREVSAGFPIAPKGRTGGGCRAIMVDAGANTTRRTRRWEHNTPDHQAHTRRIPNRRIQTTFGTTLITRNPILWTHHSRAYSPDDPLPLLRHLQPPSTIPEPTSIIIEFCRDASFESSTGTSWECGRYIPFTSYERAFHLSGGYQGIVG